MRSTTDPSLRSFIDVPHDADFPIQNLPYGVFTPDEATEPRIGVAIGEWILDLGILQQRGMFNGPQLRGRSVFTQPSLNAFIELGPAAWNETREQVSMLLRHDVATLRDNAALRDQALNLATEVQMHLPCEIRDFSDFYASKTHATNASRIFRGDDASLPQNFLHMPLAYHARASTIVVSDTEIVRPRGQLRTSPDAEPIFGPTRALDFELEIGLIVGRGNQRGTPIAMGRAPNQMFGLVLLNDWSARDIQRWEATPLGPFQSKNFATTISPWVVPMAALEPFRTDAPPQDPPPLPYLQTKGAHAFDIHLEAAIEVPTLDAPHTICRTNFKTHYWTLIQQLVHHAASGCELRPGDLIGSGTVSSDGDAAQGCLLELTWNGQYKLDLPGELHRTYLDDGDTVTLGGWCQADGYRVGFGECRGSVVGCE